MEKEKENKVHRLLEERNHQRTQGGSVAVAVGATEIKFSKSPPTPRPSEVEFVRYLHLVPRFTNEIYFIFLLQYWISALHMRLWLVITLIKFSLSLTFSNSVQLSMLQIERSYSAVITLNKTAKPSI